MRSNRFSDAFRRDHYFLRSIRPISSGTDEMWHWNSCLLDSLQIEAAGIRHNALYSVNCVRIACRSGNITFLGSPQVFERILLQLFLHDPLHFGALGKEAKSLFYIEYQFRGGFEPPVLTGHES